MSDAKASEKGDRQDRAPDQVRAPDAQDARVAVAGDLKAAHALNRNAHSGSAGGDQEHSIELVMPKKDGG